MAMRNHALQIFLDAAKNAFSAQAKDPRAIQSINHIFAKLTLVAPQSTPNGTQLPICRYLEDFSNPAKFDEPVLRKLIACFFELEPQLVWHQREGNWDGASENFADTHANAVLVGPKGLEQREDVWLGVSLLGPNVQYPDHRHTPEETYLVLGEGGFCQGHNDWVHVTTGETFFNPYNIIHSMRTQARPLLAFWALKEKPGTA
ncbi:hypothetical protein ROLI_006580 [Roseobacter fucihabitans]|uniref:Transcriptional regulator n=1 Tax=Roseobacter fucihabitans TaxID=1537242 RepID=A0ABZ2BNJ2_9RHOB|nr:dimethylsulfoniopropionate lyase [Roseobacter litoralis]MBC6966277.1 hypothetical protein [Roseobacter litoralis]